MMIARFKDLKEAKGVNNSDVAKATGISPSTLSEWVNGKHKLKTENVKKLAEYFGVTTDYLLYGKEPTHLPFTEVKPIIELTPSTSENIKRIMAYVKLMDEKGIESLAQYAEFLSRKGE